MEQISFLPCFCFVASAWMISLVSVHIEQSWQSCYRQAHQTHSFNRCVQLHSHTSADVHVATLTLMFVERKTQSRVCGEMDRYGRCLHHHKTFRHSVSTLMGSSLKVSETLVDVSPLRTVQN